MRILMGEAVVVLVVKYDGSLRPCVRRSNAAGLSGLVCLGGGVP